MTTAIEVGPWDRPTAHRIAGTITFSNPTTLVIENFEFDGMGVGKCKEVGLKIKILCI